MPYSPGAVRVDPNGQTAVVTFTLPNGGTPVAYSSVNGSGTISLPATITVPTTFYFTEQTQLVVSALVSSVESASASGTVTVDLSGGGTAGVRCVTAPTSSGPSTSVPRVIFIAFGGTGPDPDTGLVQFDSAHSGDNINWGAAFPDGLSIDPDNPALLHIPADTFMTIAFDVRHLTIDPSADLSSANFPRLSLQSGGEWHPGFVWSRRAGWDAVSGTQDPTPLAMDGVTNLMLPAANAPGTISVGCDFFTIGELSWTWQGNGASGIYIWVPS